MNPNHCVSLELSKQLKEAGYKQEGEFWWSWLQDANFNNHIALVTERQEDWYGDIATRICYVAPLASEIMERLPHSKIAWIGKTIDGRYRIDEQDGGHTGAMRVDENLCNALAKMWLYLKKEKLI